MMLIQKPPGVGRKPANVVLNEAFGIVEGIAVDTHVFRIAHKLKLVGPSADTPQKTEDALLKLYPRQYWGADQSPMGAVRKANLHRSSSKMRRVFLKRSLPEQRKMNEFVGGRLKPCNAM